MNIKEAAWHSNARIANNQLQQLNNSTNSAQSQRVVILEWLRLAPMTTLQARNELYIMAPAARVFELKAQGHNIVTYWVKAGKKKIAQYVLLDGER